MNLPDCYRLLGLRTGAPFREVKASYRRLARQYHPDVNPDNQAAKDKFIQLTEAYRILSQALPHQSAEASARNADRTGTKTTASGRDANGAATPSSATTSAHSSSSQGRSAAVSTAVPQPQVQRNPDLSELEQGLKQTSYNQLQVLLRQRKFPRAIALVEGLAQRIPNDNEVRQWQAITYQRWGRQLIADGQFSKAQVYLQKALRTDPHNKSLHHEVSQDFQRLQQVF